MAKTAGLRSSPEDRGASAAAAPEDEPRGDGAAAAARVPALLASEDWWAVWIGTAAVAACVADAAAGGGWAAWAAVRPPRWAAAHDLASHLRRGWPAYAALGAGSAAAFAAAAYVMRRDAAQFARGFAVVFVVAAAVQCLGAADAAKRAYAEEPLVALVVGLLWSNAGAASPAWLEAALRPEWYIKVGIVLMGGTLPARLVAGAGPLALLQATVVSVTTFAGIYAAATRAFRREPRFAAVLAAAGSVCGVSAAVAVGGAVRASREEVAVASAVVTLWGVVMVFVLPAACAAAALPPAVAGAWIGTSEFADAAGLAAASAIPAPDDAAVRAFTLMKVLGRDVWIGVWCLALSIVSATWWEPAAPDRPPAAAAAGRAAATARVVWDRFPKFVFGFFAACTGCAAAGAAGAAAQGSIKALRTWAFVLAFLCIGLTTRVRDLLRGGLPPFLAFACGVALNVPLGYFLSAVAFRDYWHALDGAAPPAPA